MKIWVHTLVKNEERYLWFAVESVVDYVDRILLWDTGSTDKTKNIIRLLQKKHPEKIDTSFLGEVNPEEFTLVRQKMLKQTQSDWFVIVDGDEVWWDDGIKEVTNFVRQRGNDYESIVNHYFNIVGDIFHHQEEEAGMYKIDGIKGHINIRFVNRKIPGLCFAKPHGQQGLYDENGILIQEREKTKRYHFDKRMYLHFTNVIRSSNLKKDWSVPKRNKKLKFELGRSFPFDFYYPEVFFKPKPDIVQSPWEKRDAEFVFKSILLYPLKYIKRRIKILEKTGY